jgi:hypothetical protein
MNMRFTAAALGLGAMLLASCADGPSSRSVRAAVREHVTAGDGPAWACGVVLRKGEYEIDFESVDVESIAEQAAEDGSWAARVRVKGKCEPTLFLVGQMKEDARTRFDRTLDVKLLRGESGAWKARGR